MALTWHFPTERFRSLSGMWCMERRKWFVDLLWKREEKESLSCTPKQKKKVWNRWHLALAWGGGHVPGKLFYVAKRLLFSGRLGVRVNPTIRVGFRVKNKIGLFGQFGYGRVKSEFPKPKSGLQILDPTLHPISRSSGYSGSGSDYSVRVSVSGFVPTLTREGGRWGWPILVNTRWFTVGKRSFFFNGC